MACLITFIILISIPLILLLRRCVALTEDEMIQVANNRRNIDFRKYYSFNIGEYIISQEFKSNINASGSFCKVNIDLPEFPSIIASLLKGKKHEWIVIGFENDRKIFRIWINKGPNRSSVAPLMSHDEILELAVQQNCISVLVLHNHPGAEPNYFNSARSSKADIISANVLAEILKKAEINLLEFICERGRPYLYFANPADSFFPINQYIINVHNENGKTVRANYHLRAEK
jgi:hypothetical protein